MSLPPQHEPPQLSAGTPRRRVLLSLLAATVAVSACGGGGGADGGGAPVVPPPPPPPPPPPAVNGPAWSGFGRDAQHSSLGGGATQDLNRIAWQMPVDLAPPYTSGGALLAHYGSPVITPRNTVLVPVKTGSGGGFRVEARAGANGALLWQLNSDYRLPPGSSWVPSWNLALNASSRLYAPTSGGRLLARDDADSATGALQTIVFYGATNYAAALDTSVYINTPPTVDAAGNVYFGFIANTGNAAGLVSGIARVAPDGSGTWRPAAEAASDLAIAKVATNSAPALSNDGRTLYVVVNIAPQSGVTQRGYLLALDSSNLATQARVALVDPGTGGAARISDNGTASPTVGPDGDVYIGVLETTFGSHNGRGWLLHFNATLGTTRLPGGFGWDDTASVVPASLVPSYSGTSSYLLMVKYNNYYGVGSGNGDNQVAILDPHTSQVDAISGLPIMREVLKLSGITPDFGGQPGVREWCVNIAAVDPVRKSVLVNSEDGYLYRWDLVTNSFTQRIQLTSGIAESYTPTALGADGAVYAINNAVLFSIAA